MTCAHRVTTCSVHLVYTFVIADEACNFECTCIQCTSY